MFTSNFFHARRTQRVDIEQVLHRYLDQTTWTGHAICQRAGYAPMLSPTHPAKKMFDRMSVRRDGRMDV